MTHHHTTRPARSRRTLRRGFNLVELLVALSISATLLTATMVALDASFKAYQMTTEVASTHTIARLTMHRMLALIRTSKGDRVILALGEGRFRPSQVTPGIESDDKIEVIAGLNEGETIVVESQFLIDSEASLDAGLLRLSAPSMPKGQSMEEMEMPEDESMEDDQFMGDGQ